MERKTVRLEDEDGRWLEMTVEDERATARVGTAEPFPFRFDNLAYVARGMGYQAWGEGGHFACRSEIGGVAVEFQGPDERHPAVIHLSNDDLRSTIDRLDAFAPARSSVSVL